MLMSAWKKDFAPLWKNGTLPSVSWNKEKRRPSFWILTFLFTVTMALAFCGTPEDPQAAQLLARGWAKQRKLCENLQPGEFGELEFADQRVEVYRALDKTTFASAEAPEEALCRVIQQPTYVEEI